MKSHELRAGGGAAVLSAGVSGSFAACCSSLTFTLSLPSPTSALLPHPLPEMGRRCQVRGKDSDAGGGLVGLRF